MPIVSSPWLSVCPRVRKRKGRLIATTAWRVRILSLGLMIRRVTIDPQEQQITISRRLFWFFPRRRRIRFGAVAAVTYGYSGWKTNYDWWGTSDTFDIYSVGLRLHGAEELRLFYFYGDGEFVNDGPWPDWFYWPDYVFDLTGTQTKESRAYVEVLSKMIGVAIAPPGW